ncbi:alpha/beta-hydrolase [Hypoxylon trugodes]|uniref:alpha/beta-hydrolase n=1 Tax=Hypoxylon trugodes TaxID=326681 RepID=UPI0021991AB2|nr:alpha/beta-hydrolase [Hypoxylon trugodes]KAI1385417.1 alpha/beta-hydrolase [Hypoxylon trugodes]
MRRAASSATTSSSWRTRDDTLPIGSRTMSASSWTTTTPPDTANGEGLFFSSLNPLAPITVVMLHVLLSSHLEWSHCWPQLSEYHLLIPDLPQHSRSRHVGPFSFALAADLIANMIREHAHDARAHIVGLSTGGFVAMELIKRHPDVVLSAFVSNAVPVNELWRSINARPTMAYVGLSVLLYSPKSLLFKATGWAPEFQNDELLKEIRKNNTSRLYEAGSRETGNWSPEDMAEVGKKDKRVVLVAGGKQDNVEGAREMGHLLKSLGLTDGKESRAFLVKDAIHAWNLQYPSLFARGVRAWIERTPLPQAYEPLEMIPTNDAELQKGT